MGMADVTELNLKGLACPMPILKTKQALMKLMNNEVIKVITTDPHSEIDFKAYLARTSHKLLEFREEKGVFVFVIEKVE